MLIEDAENCLPAAQHQFVLLPLVLAASITFSSLSHICVSFNCSVVLFFFFFVMHFVTAALKI